ncbi:hypothetical protein ACIBHX_41930 [Nonomuraea sp. NPDC050536]
MLGRVQVRDPSQEGGLAHRVRRAFEDQVDVGTIPTQLTEG